MEITLKLANDTDADTWDDIVNNSPQGSIFHKWKWLKIAEQYTHSTLVPVLGLKGSVVIGLYPLFQQKKFGINAIFSPPPKTAVPYLGPVLVDYNRLKQSKRESIFKSFHNAVDKYIFSDLKANYAMILPGPTIDPRPFIWRGYDLKMLFDYKIDLSAGSKTIWESFDKDARDHIKKIDKINKEQGDPISVRKGTRDDVAKIYNSLIRRYKEQNKVITISPEYLTEIFNNFHPENMKIFVVTNKGELENGVISLVFNDTLSFWIGAAKPEKSEISSNEICHWEAIRWACENNIHQFEEFGANLERLARLKSKYNPELRARFQATKYSSQFIKFVEYGYKNIIKPVLGKIQF